MRKGILLALEGIDAAGGEEQSNRILEYCRSKNIPAEKLTYPDYSTPIGKAIHDYLHENFELSEEILALLHATDRIKDKEKIKQWIEQGKLVICDRYYTSTLAYQGMKVPLEKLLKLAEMFDLQKPDIIVYLKISPETSIKRKRGEKGDNLDRNEASREVHEAVAKSYEKLIEKQVFGSWFVVDGEKSIEEVFEDIKKILRI